MVLDIIELLCRVPSQPHPEPAADRPPQPQEVHGVVDRNG